MEQTDKSINNSLDIYFDILTVVSEVLNGICQYNSI